ncbi:aldo/keto reductase [Granulicella aggregans]|uniref:aldo/keto reductase n=1 Tax=Granulicella aggregans TaxID=474949 RepID=UPI0021E05A52|nr:aldo/keto reductase [Granulicella aggregans]
MLYRPLGSTKIDVSIIGFGAATLGDVFGAMTADGVHRTVQYAIDRGINFFDVSPYYGETLAEQRLGDALAGRRKDVVLATKCGRYGSNHFDFSADTITREFEASLRRLKTDSVDLLQVHDVEFGSMKQILEETLPAMRRLQQQGKVRFLGITGYWPDLLARILEQVPVDTVLNYCHNNLLADDMDMHLTPVAERLGVGLVNASPLHMGLLSGGPIAEWHPAPRRVKDAAATMVEVCRANEVQPAVVALSHCLTHPFVATTLVGFRSMSEVDDALFALEYQTPPKLLREIFEISGPVHNISWSSGLPENQPTSQDTANQKIAS